MDATIDASFVQRVTSLENGLLEPIIDASTLTSFKHQWATFAVDFQAALKAQTLSISTISMSHDLADRMSGVIQTFTDLDVLSSKLMSSLAIEASSILPTASDDATTHIVSPQSPYLSMSSQTHYIHAGSPSYIQPSYQWLLKNIHNPYPSSRTRNNIANETSSSRKDIDGWFVDARKRIGWNTLRKARFSNKRVEIVDAATRFFVEDDPKRPLDPNIELEFAAIETRAKDLYSEKFSESDLATKLDMVVKDMTPETKAQAKEEGRRRIMLQRDEESNMRISRAISSYPSPDHSPNRSPVLDLSPSADGDDAAPFPNESNPGCKRRCSPSDPADCSVDRPNKRFRLDVPPPPFSGLPSPASSFHEDLHESPSTVASTSSNAPVTHAPNRKRRLSDADVQGAPKRPRNLPAGPRLHAVSDPLPISSEASAFDGWYNKFFEFPNTASVDQLDASIPVEVELCDTSAFDVNALRLSSSIFEAASPSDPPAHVIPSSVSPSPPPPLEAPSLSLDANLSEFDFADLLASNDFTYQFQGQSVVNEHEFYSPFDIPPLDLGFSFNAFHPHTAFPMPLPTQNVNTPGLPDFLTSISAQPPSDIDWSFSRFLSPSPLQDSSHDLRDVFNRCPPENSPFDLMMFNPTQPNSDVVDVTHADRAAKEKRLLEMKEEARRLEEELATSR